MDERIIRKLYNEYLSEAFNLDSEEYQNNCYIITDQRATKFFINPEKKTVDKYFAIGEFQCGYALVHDNQGYNFINEQGELLLKKWVPSATDFSNGYALVSDGSLSNFIDTEGNYIFKSPRFISNDSKFYPNGVAIIGFVGEGVNIINNKGKKLLPLSFYSIDPFQGKYAVAIQKKRNLNPAELYKYWNYECHIISCDGEDIKTDYEDLKQVAEGIFVAKEKNKDYRYLIDYQGNRIGNTIFETFYGQFKEGYLVVENNGVRNLIGKDGKYLYKNWYLDITPLENGVCKVKAENDYSYLNDQGEMSSSTKMTYSFLDLDGYLFSHEWFDQVYNFYEGMAVVKKDNEYRILYRNGTLSDETFSDVNDAFSFINEAKENTKKEKLSKQGKKELCRVQGYGSINYEFPDGTLFFNNPQGLVSNMSNGTFAYYHHGELTLYNKYGEKIADFSDFPFLSNTTTINLKTILNSPKAKKVTSTKKWFHYSYEVDGKKYLLDYEPVTDYGDIVICQNQNLYYVFEKATLNTVELGKKANISLEADYIKIDQKKYFISGLDFIDVTDLPFEQTISKKLGIKSIKTYEEFKTMCQSPEYKERIEAEIATLKKQIEEEKKARLIEEANQKKEEEKRLLETKKESLRKSLGSLSELLTQCSKYINEIQLLVNSNSYEKVSVPEELLLIPVADHLEINPIFLTQGILKFIDLSTISFANVKVSGLDLSYTNAQINPQEVYKKDMSNGKYCGMNFNLASFKDVNTLNSDFTGAILDFATDIETIARGK